MFNLMQFSTKIWGQLLRHKLRLSLGLGSLILALLIGPIPSHANFPNHQLNNNWCLPNSQELYAQVGAPINNNNLVHQKELRGAWVASVANIDWPSQRGLTVAQQKAELITILNRLQELNMNAIILQVRPAADAFYDSKIEPWSAWLTGTQGVAPNPYYDPLEFAVAESHKRNIELHAWFNPYRAQNKEQYKLAPNHVANTYPQYVYEYGGLLWMDPGAKPIQDQTYNVIIDVVKRYDIDAIHLDDYFYPYPVDGEEFPDNNTYNSYLNGGGTLGLEDWRRDNVNRLVKRLYQGIHAAKPHVKFGISPFGINRPGQPPGIRGFDQYEGLYADPEKWLAQGWVDYIAPQLYWRIDPPQQSYPALLGWWVQNNPQRRHVYAGNNLSQFNGNTWTISEYQRQVAISRRMSDRLSLGNIFFSMKVFKENRLGINNTFKSSIYNTPALTPSMSWLDNTPPVPPVGVVARAGVITWEPSNSNDIRSWSVYQQRGNGWQIIKILNANTTNIKVAPGNYGIRAVDRMSNESSPVIIGVQ